MQEAAKNIKPVDSSKVVLTRERTDWPTAAFDQEITISKRVWRKALEIRWKELLYNNVRHVSVYISCLIFHFPLA